MKDYKNLKYIYIYMQTFFIISINIGCFRLLPFELLFLVERLKDSISRYSIWAG